MRQLRGEKVLATKPGEQTPVCQSWERVEGGQTGHDELTTTVTRQNQTIEIRCEMWITIYLYLPWELITIGYLLYIYK